MFRNNVSKATKRNAESRGSAAVTQWGPSAVFVVALLCWACGLYVGRERGIPFVTKQHIWSIGIYRGDSPVSLAAPVEVHNPVLTARDVTDVPALFVADPFMVREGSTWYMFFEVFNTGTNQGDIGLATSTNGVDFQYRQIVLDEPFMLSYPYVFKWQGRYYMIPESSERYWIRLYKASHFPTKWEFVANLIHGAYMDSSIFRHGGKWWIFASDRDDVLHLFFADQLTGPWVEHPLSPLIERNGHIARPAGRVLEYNGQLIRFAQDCDPVYGKDVVAFKITKLTPQAYEEQLLDANPVLSATGRGWNADRMHQVDAHQVGPGQWIACVDGCRRTYLFGLEY